MPQRSSLEKVKVVDLFCGIGGMTHGFVIEGFDVIAGIDIDETCRFGYENNNLAKFIHKDIFQVNAEEIQSLYGGCEINVLIGCAPCQPYSDLNRKGGKERDKAPLEKFAELIEKIQPEIVSMENVKGLANEKKYPEFDHFLHTLEKNNYKVFYKVIDASDYGVPQTRKRLVLLASRIGEIRLLPPTHAKKKVTVRDVIGYLEPISDGESSSKDPLHKASKLSPLNKKRIESTPKDGGDSRAWDEKLLPDCYKKESGKSYRNTVYGRMKWDQPGSTMTTHCTGLGNGRFGHPEQNRAISLREAALLQTFPVNYEFTSKEKGVPVKQVSRFIGNAVPVKLSSIIAQSIRAHIENHEKKQQQLHI